MKKIICILGALILAASLVQPLPTAADQKYDVKNLPIPVDISHRLKGKPAPKQLDSARAAAVVAQGKTTCSQCGGTDETLTITISSFDPQHPGTQDVVFWRETPSGSTGKATLWVAWDSLATAYDRRDVITCEQLAYLQSQLDRIVETDVNYFGDYTQRPAGNPNIDVMIYNIVDESYYDSTFPFYVAGFFWSSVNETFDRNMIFIDSLDWANRLGPDVARPYLYEGTVAHELEHLIHNDHDADEDSWVDEGLADLAQYFCGFGHDDGHVVYYLAFHRTSLTNWGGGLESYGASYLFQLYLLEQFGAKSGSQWDNTWTRKLVNEQANSIAGMEAATGADFDDLFDSWMLANYLDNPALTGPGRFRLGYNEIDLNPFVSTSYSPWSIQRSIKDIYGSDHNGNLPVSRYYGGYRSGTVEYPIGTLPPYAPLYGTYTGIQPGVDFSMRGDTKSGVAPHGGSYEMASGAANMLTDRMLKLNVPVGGTLTFWTWYDIEEEWDYGFVEVSTDNGATWHPIPGSITKTSNNPNQSTAWKNSLLGNAASSDAVITGSSGGWVQATFALPAASDVLVRFAYYTDEASLRPGWFIDDVAVNGFSDCFESGAGNWTLGGWVHTTGLFDNDWLVAHLNPIYNKGNFDHLDVDYLDQGNVSQDGSYELLHGTLDTSSLNREAVTLAMANRAGDSPFDSGYQLLVKKLDASKKQR